MSRTKSEDITPAIIKKCVADIRGAATPKEAIKIFIAFCERYRKNCAARKARLTHTPEQSAEASRRWWAANRERCNEKRNAANRVKAEREWRSGLRKRKPRHLK